MRDMAVCVLGVLGLAMALFGLITSTVLACRRSLGECADALWVCGLIAMGAAAVLFVVFWLDEQ